MRYTVVLFFSLIVLAAGAAPAAAQPEQGTVAIGADLGFVMPTPSNLDGSTTFGGLVEYYVTPRVGIRGTVRTFDVNSSDDVFETENTSIGLHGTYNWEYGVWHPFVGGGVSFNRLEVGFDDDVNGDDDAFGESTKPGLDIFGGAEYFFAARTTLKFEVGLQRMGDFEGFDGPSNVSFLVGLKHYFGR